MGIYDVDFDWLEEDGCIEAHPSFNGDFNKPAIVAHCDCCDSQEIKLKEIGQAEFEASEAD
jgi:hypothetical protein